MRAFLLIVLLITLPAAAADLRCEITASGGGRPISCRAGLVPVEPALGEKAAPIPLYEGSTRVTCPELHLWTSISIEDENLTMMVADDDGRVLGLVNRPFDAIPEVGKGRPLEVFAGTTAVWLGSMTVSCARPPAKPLGPLPVFVRITPPAMPDALPTIPAAPIPPPVAQPPAREPIAEPRRDLPLTQAIPISPPVAVVEPAPGVTPTVPSADAVMPAPPLVVMIARAPWKPRPHVVKPKPIAAPTCPAAPPKPKPKPVVKPKSKPKPTSEPPATFEWPDGQRFNEHDIY